MIRKFPTNRFKINDSLISKLKRIIAKKYIPKESIYRSYEIVNQVLYDADEFGLAPEVIIAALQAMKQNNKLTIGQSMIEGYEECIR